MTDIVEVIRPDSKGDAVVMIAAHKLHTAADEIERLTELVHTLAQPLPDDFATPEKTEIERLLNENKRLRDCIAQIHLDVGAIVCNALSPDPEDAT